MNVRLEPDILLYAGSFAGLKTTIDDSLLEYRIRSIKQLRFREGFSGELNPYWYDPVEDQLKEWAKSNKNEFDKIIANLEKVAESPSYCFNNNVVKTLKHEVQELKELISKKGKARLFFFQDNQLMYLISIGTYWKTGRSQSSENKTQNKAIDAAAKIKKMWDDAVIIDGFKDYRLRQK